MAKEKDDRRVGSGGARYGPGEGEGAADALQENLGPSRDAKDYVLVTKYHEDADGLRIEAQVLKNDLEESDEYSDFSLDSDEVKESHPAANRPTSDLNDEEVEAQGRARPRPV